MRSRASRRSSGGEERGKGQTIGIRAAALLETDATAQRKMRKEVTALYDLRSAILHGDAVVCRDSIDMPEDFGALQIVLCVLTGWLDRQEREAVAYLIEENRVL